MQHQHSEKGNPQTGLGVSISQGSATSEVAEAHGTYHVTATGPVEWARERYCELHTLLSNAKEGMIGMADLFREFMAIPIEVKWADTAPNIVTTVGKNLALDTFLAGSGYTVVGPYLGLCNTNASAAVIGDTMASHAGWLEVGATNAPQYTAPRKTVAWNAAASGSKAASAAASFGIITTGGTVGGCFLVFGSGALSTIDNTAGVLYSAGAFTGGSKVVAPGDTLNVTYTASL